MSISGYESGVPLGRFRRVVENELRLQSIARGRINFSGLDAVNGKSVRLTADLETGKEVV